MMRWLGSWVMRIVRWYDRRQGTVPYQSEYFVPVQFTIRYMDRDKIHDEVLAVLHARGWTGTPKHRIYGWYDYKSKVLYCEMYDFHTAGHELFHATHGSFHDSWSE